LSTTNLMRFVANITSSAPRHAMKTLAHAGIYALGAKVFTVINPLAGAIVGGTYYASTTAIDWICTQAHIGQSGFMAKITRSALSSIAGVSMGILVAKAAGFPLTFTAALILPAASLGIYCLAAGAVVVAIVGIGSIVVNNFSLEVLLTTGHSLLKNNLPVNDDAQLANNK